MSKALLERTALERVNFISARGILPIVGMNDFTSSRLGGSLRKRGQKVASELEHRKAA